jgi:hypothetical protein
MYSNDPYVVINAFLVTHGNRIYFVGFGFPAKFLVKYLGVDKEILFHVCYQFLSGIVLGHSLRTWANYPLYTKKIVLVTLPYKSYKWERNFCAWHTLLTMFYRMMVNNPSLVINGVCQNKTLIDLCVTMKMHNELDMYDTSVAFAETHIIPFVSDGTDKPIWNGKTSTYLEVTDIFKGVFSRHVISPFNLVWTIDSKRYLCSGIVLNSSRIVDAAGHRSSLSEAITKQFDALKSCQFIFSELCRECLFVNLRFGDGDSLVVDNKRALFQTLKRTKVESVSVSLPDILYLRFTIQPDRIFSNESIDSNIDIFGNLYALSSVCYWKDKSHFFCRTVESDGVYEYDGMIDEGQSRKVASVVNSESCIHCALYTRTSDPKSDIVLLERKLLDECDVDCQSIPSTARVVRQKIYHDDSYDSPSTDRSAISLSTKYVYTLPDDTALAPLTSLFDFSPNSLKPKWLLSADHFPLVLDSFIDSMNSFLRASGKVPIGVADDGNCVFYACLVSLELKMPKEESHKMLRKIVSQKLVEMHEDFFITAIFELTSSPRILDLPAREKKKYYINQMKKCNVFGTATELMIIAELFDIEIYSHKCYNGTFTESRDSFKSSSPRARIDLFLYEVERGNSLQLAKFQPHYWGSASKHIYT